jgi:hypothetical protein
MRNKKRARPHQAAIEHRPGLDTVDFRAHPQWCSIGQGNEGVMLVEPQQF